MAEFESLEAEEMHRLRERIARLEAALIEIRDADPVELALDPHWASRVAREALKP